MSLHSRLSQILANRTLKHIDFHTEMNRGKASVRTHQLYVQRLWENILSNKNAIQTIEISYLLTRVTKMVVKTCLNISPRSWKINALWRAPLFFFCDKILFPPIALPQLSRMCLASSSFAWNILWAPVSYSKIQLHI